MPRRYYPRVEDDDFDWPAYTSVGERRQKSQRHAARLKNADPVIISGSRIANSFWGKSWCQNLERYSDYSNRLPRGRTYVRSGCVIDLKIQPAAIHALVSGTVVYDVAIQITPIPSQRWKTICGDVSGGIDSLVQLLKGEFSKDVVERLCQQKTGLFPSPSDIKFTCSCPDSARMCKHVSAALYGVGARLDRVPELLFLLRKVKQEDLITKAGARITKAKSGKILEGENLSELFGIDIAEPRAKRRK